MTIGARIRRVIINGDPQSVRYANGATYSQWTERYDPQIGSRRTWSTVGALHERCDPQPVGLPNVTIRRQVIGGRGPKSVRNANDVTHSQWVCRTLRSADRWPAYGVRSLCDTRTV